MTLACLTQSPGSGSINTSSSRPFKSYLCVNHGVVSMTAPLSAARQRLSSAGSDSGARSADRGSQDEIMACLQRDSGDCYCCRYNLRKLNKNTKAVLKNYLSGGE